MNKAVAFVIAVSLLFSFAETAFSAEKEKQIKLIAGAVTAVDIKKKTLTLQNTQTNQFTCTLDDKTLLRIDNGRTTIADIKVGDVAAVVYREVNGRQVAQSITVKSPPGSSSAEKAKPATSEKKK